MTIAKSKTICILSDSPFLPTGYSNTMKQLASHFVEQGHDVHYLANAFNGATIEYARLDDGTEFKFKIYGEMMQTYFRNSMSRILKEINADIFIINLDTFMLHGGDAWFLGVDTSPAKTFFLYPSDGGGGLPKGCERILQKIDVPVCMSKFGQKQVMDYYQLKSEHIPLCINTERFHPISPEEKEALKTKWNLSGKFVIGVVARNQPRKNLDRTIKMMIPLAKKIPNAVLFLHLDPDDPAQPMFKIRDLVRKYNLENRVVYSGMEAHNGFGWDKMNDVYNLMDVFLLTTSGEGFGIPIVEAMACEIPVVATDYTTTQELILDNKAGLGIKLSGVESVDILKESSSDYDLNAMNGTITGSWEVERGICDILHGADQVEYLYNNPKEAKQMGKNGRKAAVRDYDFKVVAKAWDVLIDG